MTPVYGSWPDDTNQILLSFGPVLRPPAPAAERGRDRQGSVLAWLAEDIGEYFPSLLTLANINFTQTK